MKFSRSTYATAASLAVLAVAVPAAVIYWDRPAQREVFADRQPAGGVLDMFSSDGKSAGRLAGPRQSQTAANAPPPTVKEETRIALATGQKTDKDSAKSAIAPPIPSLRSPK